MCETQENSSSRKRRRADIKHNSTRKDARLEDRSASLAIITIDSSDDDDVDNNEDEVVAAAPPSKQRDNRKTKRGCAKRIRYSSRHKVDWVNEVDEAMCEGLNPITKETGESKSDQRTVKTTVRSRT